VRLAIASGCRATTIGLGTYADTFDMSLKSALKIALFGTSGWLGVQAFARWAHRRRLMVLCYHGVVAAEHAGADELGRHAYRNTVPATEFDRQMDILRRKFTPVSPQQVVAWAEGESALPDRAVLVTFDDGYRNNLTHALPILQRHGIQALVSVTTDYIGTDRLLWPTEVETRIGQAASGTEIPSPNGTDVTVVSSSGADRRVQLDAIRGACKRMPGDELVAYLDRLRGATAVRPADLDLQLTAFLSWDEVRELVAAGVTIASHTVSHPILTQIDADPLRRELVESKRKIEAELGVECAVLVYPNGGAEDYSPTVVAAVEAAGYRAAFRLTNGSNAETVDSRFAIDRVDVPGHALSAAFDVRACGLFSRLSGSPDPH
jgi:peptidoglycan/xylan/chitin deacetylase (PgdA/CDA1 family)